jgi:hypothetical protein
MSENNQGPPSRVPIWIFLLESFYLIALVAVGLIYIHWGPLQRLLPSSLGTIPVAVPWWGALGGITISFTGIFRNSDRWQTRYELWHIARPFLGAVVGSVSYLIFIALIRATGTTPSHQSPINNAVYYLVAFLTGYREDVFRELLKRATDSLFTPSRRDQ